MILLPQEEGKQSGGEEGTVKNHSRDQKNIPSPLMGEGQGGGELPLNREVRVGVNSPLMGGWGEGNKRRKTKNLCLTYAIKRG